MTGPVPLETRVMVLDPWEPTVTSPKSTFVGAESETVCGAPSPVPIRLMRLGTAGRVVDERDLALVQRRRSTE